MQSNAAYSLRYTRFEMMHLAEKLRYFKCVYTGADLFDNLAIKKEAVGSRDGRWSRDHPNSNRSLDHRSDLPRFYFPD